MTTLVWFRHDLRLADHPALTAGIARSGAVIPVYIWAPGEEASWGPGGASRWWLHHSLAALDAELRARGSHLILRVASDSGRELSKLARETGATHVLWNRRYEPAAVARDAHIKAALREEGLACESFNGALLREPWEIKTGTGGPYQVFTAFRRNFLDLPEPARPATAPSVLKAPVRWPPSHALAELKLLPRLGWDGGIASAWKPGSAAAQARLREFLRKSLAGYADRRDRPDLEGTSRLSPYLHFGEIGVREIWHALRKRTGSMAAWRDSPFVAEILWREFAHHLLYHFPETPVKPLRSAFAAFGWSDDAALLEAWRRGRTGYPIVDAGMRQLWQTGWMHNRVRMIVASFLVKDLLISWQEGSRWFWDTLVDADLANNTLNWQWSAGCGADAAPYFRIFNPVMQGRRFDPQGEYVKRYVPELARLPAAWIHEPWNAPAGVLAQAGVKLGDTYSRPLVDHGEARRRALQALAALKSL